MTYIVKCPDGSRWKVREAMSLKKALGEIAHAKVLGSVGSKSVLNETYVGGGLTIQADVVQLNSDNTERQAYQEVY